MPVIALAVEGSYMFVYYMCLIHRNYVPVTSITAHFSYPTKIKFYTNTLKRFFLPNTIPYITLHGTITDSNAFNVQTTAQMLPPN